MTVRSYGEAAVITGRSTIKVKVKVNGEGVSRDHRLTDVWVKQNNRWQAIASQVSLIL